MASECNQSSYSTVEEVNTPKPSSKREIPSPFVVEFHKYCSLINNICLYADSFVDFEKSLPEYIQVIMLLEKLHMVNTGVSSYAQNTLDDYVVELGNTNLEEEYDVVSSDTKCSITRLNTSINNAIVKIKDFALLSRDNEDELKKSKQRIAELELELEKMKNNST